MAKLAWVNSLISLSKIWPQSRRRRSDNWIVFFTYLHLNTYLMATVRNDCIQSKLRNLLFCFDIGLKKEPQNNNNNNNSKASQSFIYARRSEQDATTKSVWQALTVCFAAQLLLSFGLSLQGCDSVELSWVELRNGLQVQTHDKDKSQASSYQTLAKNRIFSLSLTVCLSLSLVCLCLLTFDRRQFWA